ncbi:MAG: hypothetical protein K5681_05655 [Treponema sp.]|nr:hypothetical protein [Treponema sp.]
MKKFISALVLLLVTGLAFAEKPIVQDIQALPGKNNRINIFWALPENPDEEITELRLYRSDKQINSFSQLRNLNPIANLSPDHTGYTDIAPDLNEHYYAVIAVTSAPYDLILLSFNSTVTGVRVTTEIKHKEQKKEEYEKFYPDGTMRETPLPYIDFVEGTDKEKTISEKAISSTSSLIKKNPKKAAMLTPYVFEEDLISPDGGDDYLLFEILKNYFVQQKYEETVEQIQKLTGTNINENTRNRAFFYLGEAEYFLGHYENAVKTFVKVERAYPILVKKWLDSSLDRL